jgi:hypothetical protein
MLNQGGDGGKTGVGGYTDPTIYPGANAGSAGDINATINRTLTSRGAAGGIVYAGGTGGGGNNSSPAHSEDGMNAGQAGTPGNVTVTIGSTGSVTAFTQDGAGLSPALLAKSVGGNGGSGSNATSGEDGASGGSGTNGTAGGSVTVTVQNGGAVSSQNASSYAPAIWAQSLGGVGGSAGSGPSGGATGGAGAAGGTVIVTIDGTAQTRNVDSPAIPAQSMGGTGLAIGGAGTIATTAMTGNLVQSGSGRLVVDTDHTSGQSDRLEIQGSANLAGTVGGMRQQ